MGQAQGESSLGRGSEGRFTVANHDHKRCLVSAMTRAEQLCRERGMRLTELRRQVLSVIWSGHRPLGAYDILATLSQDRGCKPQPPTVYRALEFLQNQGLVHRVQSLNAFVGCPLPGEHRCGQILLCRACGDAAELEEEEGLAVLQRSAEAMGFKVERFTVELSGLCPSCLTEESR